MGHAESVRETFGLLHPGELAELQRLAQALPVAPVVVNIGAGRGTSGLGFIEARPDLMLYTVDIQQRLTPDGSLESERIAFSQAGLAHLYGHNWVQIHGDSAAVGRDWLENFNPLADLIFIDGNHEYRGCAADIVAWLPNLAEGGYLAIHDYQRGEYDPTEYGRAHPFPGVDKAVADLLLGHYPVEAQVETLIVFRKEVA